MNEAVRLRGDDADLLILRLDKRLTGQQLLAGRVVVRADRVNLAFKYVDFNGPLSKRSCSRRDDYAKLGAEIHDVHD